MVQIDVSDGLHVRDKGHPKINYKKEYAAVRREKIHGR